MSRWKVDGFVVALAAVVVAALIFPEPGRTDGPLHWELLTTYGVCIVFFLYGLTLAPERLKQGVTRWKAHLLVVLTTFGLFPLVVLAGEAAFPNALPDPAMIGFFYVAALPSTVSSSVAMVSLARGDVAVAIFNATLSSILAVFATPALMAWYLQSTGVPVPLLPTVLKVVVLVLVPIVLGQIARRWLAGWAARNRTWIKLADRGTILAIVYGTFCDSMAEGLWKRTDPLTIIEIGVLSIALFFVVYVLTGVLTRLFGLSREDRIAAQFCGSKKSLATGVPLAPIIFAGRTDAGLIILPIMLFHFFQLLIVSVIATRHSHEAAAMEARSAEQATAVEG
ncbi:bile acid:sodium symporter family protein [Consotaella salsifontis]|uniref:Solute carrier family 10 (Sodium/bile acid cotransporter), member 7 n=1 Tax=Consotaella salsifontis TaxID=1365950 RepID=A0A1T4TBH5_9HYPH|nr:bile acid:sodium symporter family protein [Consotaella salsifontis]SKA37681.1 solute carrier family 10 (sodium/bile acid cotransporter), member 7 [Consotaella salsifontis]